MAMEAQTPHAWDHMGIDGFDARGAGHGADVVTTAFSRVPGH